MFGQPGIIRLICVCFLRSDDKFEIRRCSNGKPAGLAPLRILSTKIVGFDKDVHARSCQGIGSMGVFARCLIPEHNGMFASALPKWMN